MLAPAIQAAASLSAIRNLANCQLYLDPANLKRQTQRGHAIFANSLANYLRVADAPPLNFGQEFSIDFWMRPDVVNVLDRTILGQFPHNGDFSNMGFAIASGGSTSEGPELRFVGGPSGGSSVTTNRLGANPAALVAAKWAHVGFVFNGLLADASKAIFYVNGVACTMNAWNGTAITTLSNSTAEFGVGNRAHSIWSSFAGAISDVAISARALTAQQMAMKFNSGYGNAFDKATRRWESNHDNLPLPVEFYPLDEAGGQPRAGIGTLGNLTEAAAAITSRKHSITALDESRFGLQFGVQSIDRRSSAPDWLPDGLNGKPCWEGFTNSRFLVAHFAKNTWMPYDTGDVFMVFQNVTALNGEELPFFSSSHEDDSVTPNSNGDNHIGILLTAATGKLGWRFQGDNSSPNSAFTGQSVLTNGETYLVNYRFAGGDHFLRVNGVDVTSTDTGGGRNHFLQRGTLRTNVGVQVIRRLFTGVINNDGGGAGTKRYGIIACLGPTGGLGLNRAVERDLAKLYGITLP